MLIKLSFGFWMAALCHGVSALCHGVSALVIKPSPEIGIIDTAEHDAWVFGVFIFHLLGGRTPRAHGNVTLTELGAAELEKSGAWFRDRYINENSSARIKHNSPTSRRKTPNKLQITAPFYRLGMRSATAFYNGLFPPEDPPVILADGEELTSGYVEQFGGKKNKVTKSGWILQPIQPIRTVLAPGDRDEINGALQLNDEPNLLERGDMGCPNAEKSYAKYLDSAWMRDMVNQTKDFYGSLHPMVNDTFNELQMSFKNAYQIWEVVNAAHVHGNHSAELVDKETLSELRRLAAEYEWNAVENVTSPIRSIAGTYLGGQVKIGIENAWYPLKGQQHMDYLPMNVQFGTHRTWMALAAMQEFHHIDTDFKGLPIPGSTIAWELVNIKGKKGQLGASQWLYAEHEEVGVRFMYSNGTASDDNMIETPIYYPMNGSPLFYEDWFVTIRSMILESRKHGEEVCGVQRGGWKDLYMGKGAYWDR